MSRGRSPKQIGFGNLAGAVRRGRDRKEKEWMIAYRATFGCLGGWKATVLEAEVLVEKVAEGGQRLMAAWRKEEVDASRHRQEKREASTTRKLLSHREG